MGTSRRYAASVDREMDDRILRRLAEGGPLQSLSPEEIGLDREPVTIDPHPRRASVWVRFGSTPALVDAEVCRWTERACGVRFRIGGEEVRAWVWMSAVTPVPANS